MAHARSHGPLGPFNPDAIPEALRQQPRWAPWKAVWSEKRQKFDKIPCHPVAPFYGLSTAKPERWGSFDQAVATARANPGLFAGVGYVMTGPHGLVGIDLDHCVADGVIADWALQVARELKSYAEFSPSGTGLRLFVEGEAAADWTNHEIGIEVYGGNEPRFLTVSGQRLPWADADVSTPQPHVLEALRAQYAREVSPPSATIISLHLPELLDELALPALDELELPWQVREFLAEGKHRGDRSRELFSAATALYSVGLADDQVFSILATNPYTLEVALDHRRQDSDRALMYLWVEHAQKAKARATSKVASVDDFDDVSTPPAPGAKAKKLRFAFEQAALYTRRKPVEWLIKGVLPDAEIGAVFGESGAGKSFLALDLAMAVAASREFKGRKASPGTVAYVCAEGAGGFSLRLRAFSEYHGVPLPDVQLHILGDAPNLLEKVDVKDLVAALKDLPGLRLIVVDTLAQVTPGANENSGEDMGRALAHCKTLKAATGAMVLLVAHAGKDSTKGLRGWSGIRGALDVEIEVERSDQHRAATITKMKDGTGEGEEFPFELASVTLGQDEDGEDTTSCVVKHSTSVPGSRRRVEPKGSNERLVLRVATELTDLPGAVTTTQLVDAAVAELPKPDDTKDHRRRNVLRAIESLVAMGRLSVAGGTVEVL